MSNRKNVPIITTDSYAAPTQEPGSEPTVAKPLMSQHEEWERLQAQAAPMAKSREEILDQYGFLPTREDASIP